MEMNVTTGDVVRYSDAYLGSIGPKSREAFARKRGKVDRIITGTKLAVVLFGKATKETVVNSDSLEKV